MRIHARPNLNGNSPKDFVDQALELKQTLHALDKQLTDLQSSVFHGRNYQTFSAALAHDYRTEDLARLEAAYRHTGELLKLADAVLYNGARFK